MTTALRCTTAAHGECLVLRPEGRLDVTTYAHLRDRLLKHAVDQPSALVVDLTDLAVDSEPLLSVFATVWLRTCDWPGVPLLLVAGPEQVPDTTALRRYVAVHATLADALAAVGEPPLRRRTERWLPYDQSSPSVVREFVRATCADWGLSPALTTDAVLVAAELVTNAVKHARSATRLRLELRNGLLTVAVSDDDARPAVMRDTTGGGRTRGYGLLLITQLATTWGCVPDRENRRKVVWAVLSTRARPAR